MKSRLSPVLDAWSIPLHAVRMDIFIPGSPERCDQRFVIEDKRHNFFLLERILSGNVPHRCRMARVLEALRKKGLWDAIPYIPDSQGRHVIHCNGGNWQLSPYVSGTPLKRPTYVFDGWRGEVMADFLIALNRTASPKFNGISSSGRTYGAGLIEPDPRQDIDTDSLDKKDNEIFSIKQYVRNISTTIARREPKLMEQLNPIVAFLDKDFMANHDHLPVAFCHGDFHPLNIIWSEHGINGVIDWEFLGYKPEIYDLANLIGCLGMEDPHSLGGDLIHALIVSLKDAGIFSSFSWEFLVEFVVALRFAWLSEWLRKNDTEMIELETVYFHLLMDNAEALKDIWQCNQKKP